MEIMLSGESRRRFEEFVRAYYLAAGREAPSFTFDPDTAIAFEVQVDGAAFTIGYDPVDSDACLFVWCDLGELPRGDDEAALLRRALSRNVALGREHGATCCIDAATQRLALYARRDVGRGGIEAFNDDLAALAEVARQWHLDHFAAQAAPAADTAVKTPVWAAFA
ncbi:MAG TPA: CesT family type III secretion system chaperone [Ramlibacter sp.]|uniref:CesT family type III secretion system chaperone n=1 Tax=Ramlibacter sp. TaxID=1917967 RepID=UPI002D06EDC4|nr:CesT family type III secretion system chaperone [Ramlibacter sp.]HVZ46577.1 CesT family type III secretion system chaperone [Ramlibacter sp.]